jgi:hypothetical protein
MSLTGGTPCVGNAGVACVHEMDGDAPCRSVLLPEIPQ